MTYVALASLVLVLLTGSGCFALLRWLIRGHARQAQAWALERASLTDRICHLAGNPWTPAPLRSVPNGMPPEPEPVFVDVDNEPEF